MTGDGVLYIFLRLFKRSVEDARTEAFYSQTTNYVAFMGYTILVWDHIISFGDEVQYIWMRPKSPATYLFFLNRYFTPIAFIGNLVAYFSGWSDSVRVSFYIYLLVLIAENQTCDHFVRYEGSCTIIALEVAALMMFLRVWALYRNQKVILSSVIALFLLETGVFAWLMTDSIPVDHYHSVVKACTMIFDPKRLGKFWPSLSAWLPLLYDTYVTILTLYRCMPQVRTSSASYIFHVLLRDGLLYYSVIFSINLILAIMIVAAPDGIKNITAQLEQMLTVAMISRITLSLRRSAAEQRLSPSDDNVHQFDLDAWYAPKRKLPDTDTAHSSTVCQHINAVSRSDLEADPGFPSQGGSMLEEIDKSDVSNMDHGTDSIGVLSISPAHTHEAAAAAGFGPMDRAAFVADPSLINDRSAYELRVMRPAHNATCTGNLRFHRF